jgi:ABC-type Fe3+-siderophore transport system permease subunit
MIASFQRIGFSSGFDTEKTMATVTITLSGSAIPGLTGTPTKSYAISDADLQLVLAWAQGAFGNPNMTNAQILIAWLTGQLITPTISAVGYLQRSLQTPPPPIAIS